MNQIEKYQKAMRIAEKIKLDIINSFKEDLKKVEGMPGWKYADGTVGGFTISSKQLSSESWLPIYYDNKLIAEKICEGLKESKSLEQISKYLKEIVETRKVDKEKINVEMANQIQSLIVKYGL